MKKFVLEISGGEFEGHWEDSLPITYQSREKLENDILASEKGDDYNIFDMFFCDYRIFTLEEWFEKNDLTKGKCTLNEYLIALQVGGIMEDPEIRYKNYEIILATSKEEAVKLYNDKHKCDYYYGVCLD